MLRTLSALLVSATLALGQGAVVTVGTGCPDSNGRISQLSTATLPTIGNAGFSVDLTFAPPSQPTFLYASIGLAGSPLSLGGSCDLYLEFTSLLGFIATGAFPLTATTAFNGAVTIGLPIPNDPGLSGLIIGVQAATLDPPLSNGFVVSNALQLTIS